MDATRTETREEIRSLAITMVRLELAARVAAQRRQWVRVGELHTIREQTQERRSRLMREIWEPRRRRREPW